MRNRYRSVPIGAASTGPRAHRQSRLADSRRTLARMTFSIVALDPATGDLAVAVQSKCLAVGAVVPWAAAGVGAVATQSFANVTYGPDGLAHLASGLSATHALERLVAADPLRHAHPPSLPG